MDQIGVPELFFVGGMFVFSLFPIIAAVWALVMLHRLRTGQEDMRRRLESIERLLQRG